MVNVHIFKITPDYSKYPSFELIVKSSGSIFKDYTWHCLPGYLKKTSGAISKLEDRSNPNLSSFFLFSEKVCGTILCKDNVPGYGYLANIPKNPAIGSKGFAIIDYMQQKVPVIMAFFLEERTFYSTWELINVC